MVITTKQKRENIIAKHPTLLFEKVHIETEDSHRVLGVLIDNNLT